jgi:CelD/BcsL family acetyltransferase involved in cellulose biosynthesis
MKYTIRAIRDTAALAALEDAWTGLLLAVPAARVFASWQWNAAWWRHWGGGARLWVLAVSGGGQLVGVAPLMVRRLGPVRKLEFLGSGLSDSGDVLVRPDHEDSVLAALFAYLHLHRGAWDLGDWSEVPPDSPLLGYLARRRPAGVRVRQIPQTACPALALPATWDAYVGGLERKRRYYVNSYPRKFAREHAGRLQIVTAPAEVDTAVTTFSRLHLARWEVKAGALSAEHEDPAFGPFLADVCARLAARGWLRLAHLRAGDDAVASSINFLLHGRWHSYMKGFDPAWSAARPGTVLDALRIQQAIAEGATVLDFGRGDEAYKAGFGVTPYRTTRLLLGTATPSSRAAFALLALRIRLHTASVPLPPPADEAR